MNMNEKDPVQQALEEQIKAAQEAGNTQELESIANDAESGFYEDVAEKAREAITHLESQKAESEQAVEEKVTEVEGLGGTSEELHDRVEPVQEEMKEVVETAEGEIGEVETTMAESSEEVAAGEKREREDIEEAPGENFEKESTFSDPRIRELIDAKEEGKGYLEAGKLVESIGTTEDIEKFYKEMFDQAPVSVCRTAAEIFKSPPTQLIDHVRNTMDTSSWQGGQWDSYEQLAAFRSMFEVSERIDYRKGMKDALLAMVRRSPIDGAGSDKLVEEFIKPLGLKHPDEAVLKSLAQIATEAGNLRNTKFLLELVGEEIQPEEYQKVVDVLLENPDIQAHSVSRLLEAVEEGDVELSQDQWEKVRLRALENGDLHSILQLEDKLENPIDSQTLRKYAESWSSEPRRNQDELYWAAEKLGDKELYKKTVYTALSIERLEGFVDEGKTAEDLSQRYPLKEALFRLEEIGEMELAKKIAEKLSGLTASSAKFEQLMTNSDHRATAQAYLNSIKR